MAGHEAIRIDLNSIAPFKLEKKIVVEALSPIGLKQPIFVMALPGHVKGGVIAEDGVSRLRRHGRQLSKLHASLRAYLKDYKPNLIE
jgi:hypothetical protein